jgi:PTH2 family peptidyl-tRNA hydrolase
MYKQVIVVRNDLKLKKGKLAAQVAHASLGAFLKSEKNLRKKWLKEGAKKVVVKVKDLKELLNIKKEAEKMKIPNFLVRDAGKTQVDPGTITCLGLGPCKEEILDKVTGGLKLL